jgi:DNA-binding CsgD family transcriptional regulator
MEAADFTGSATSPSSASNRHELSRRELEVLALVAVGRSDGEIAEQLFISKKTASVHVAHIKDKLRAQNRVEIVLLGIRLGLVEPPPDDAGTVPPG